MSINILFTDVSRCDDPEKYIREKLSTVFGNLPEHEFDELVENAYEEDKPIFLPLAMKEDFPTLTQKQQHYLDQKTNFFVGAVDRLSPLLNDETKLEEDFFTYLCDNYRHFSKWTPVLVRRTNYATIGYIYENVSVNGETAEVSYRVTRSLASGSDHEIDQHISGWMRANIPSATNPKPEETLEKLTKGLVGLLPEPYNIIGATLLSIIMPESGLDYNRLLDDIGTIIADANRRQTISEQGGILNGIVGYIDGSYVPDRDSKRYSKEELSKQLQPELTKIYEVIGVLKQEEFEKGGISTFISAVTHKYLLCQEMALQDPKVTEPKESSKANSILHDLEEDRRHGLTVIDKLQKDFDDYLDNWVNQVSPVHIRITDCPKSEWYFHDSHTGYRSPYYEQSGCNDDPHARAEKARNNYIATVRQKYRKDHQDQLPWMKAAVEDWYKLKENPIPFQ